MCMAGLMVCGCEAMMDVPPGGETEPAAYEGYALVWNDEFNVHGAPDEAHWVYEEGFIRNREAQLYTRDNIRIADGVLTIEARRERVPNPAFDASAPADDWKRSRSHAEYTSACIKTRGKHAWLYGRFEMRGRIDIRDGMWPAFWTLGTAREWPACGEIDIMEYFKGVLLANVAWGSAKRHAAAWDDVKVPIAEVAKTAGFVNQAGEGDPQAWAAAFHVWRMDWDKDMIRLYVDGHLMNEIELSKTVNKTPDGANPLREPHHILINFAIGGTAGGDPSKTEFPAKYEVDWVRVYQKAE